MMSPSDSALGELVKDSVKDFPSINDLEKWVHLFSNSHGVEVFILQDNCSHHLQCLSGEVLI